MPAVFGALADFTRPEDQPIGFAAKQTTVASYCREGYKAAAVTAIEMYLTGAPMLTEVLVRDVVVRFDRPYAVLTTAATDQGPPAWRGLPLFSAWITEPDDTAVEIPRDLQP